jgi:hypothetical protein
VSSIATVCPYCESRYNLQPEMLGKTMRCPNPDCREAFVVEVISPPIDDFPELEHVPPPAAPSADDLPDLRSSPPAAQHRTDAPPPAFVSGSVGDLIPVLDAEAVGPPPAAAQPFERVEADEVYVLPVVEGEATGPAPAKAKAKRARAARLPVAEVMDAEAVEPAAPPVAKALPARTKPSGPK